MRAIPRNRRRPPSKELVGTCEDVGWGEETCMSDCCSVDATAGTAPSAMDCAINGTRSKHVEMLTVKSLVRQLPLRMPNTQYYFCEAHDCDVVYFPFDAEAPTFRREDLLVRVGAKEKTDPIPVCYCFGFTRKDIQDEIVERGHSTFAERITAEVRAGSF